MTIVLIIMLSMSLAALVISFASALADGENGLGALIFVIALIVLGVLICTCSVYKTESETIKDYMNGKYKVEIKGIYKDSLFVPTDTIITLK